MGLHNNVRPRKNSRISSSWYLSRKSHPGNQFSIHRSHLLSSPTSPAESTVGLNPTRSLNAFFFYHQQNLDLLAFRISQQSIARSRSLEYQQIFSFASN